MRAEEEEEAGDRESEACRSSCGVVPFRLFRFFFFFLLRFFFEPLLRFVFSLLADSAADAAAPSPARLLSSGVGVASLRASDIVNISPVSMSRTNMPSAIAT